ncbi:MAG: RluA family pseudouridine synthase [Clostridia bacterium]|nr:RluA family pseudouridine synthase [Clostridia bacterium]
MKQIRITPKNAGRLDAFLLGEYKMLTKGKLHKFMRENKIKLNGKKVPLDTYMQLGDELKLFIPDEALTQPQGAPYLRAKRIFEVIYEDANLVITIKPAGLMVNDDTEADTLINRALLYLSEKGEYSKESEFKPALCHRLDTGTSGLTIIAKNEAAFNELCTLIQGRDIVKKYLCVTYGKPAKPSATLTGYLKKDAAAAHVRLCDANMNGAKEIITKYNTIDTSGRLALLEVELVTGRTHQIRLHLASIDCPILGDSKYGNNAANRELKLRYQALCAYSLTFPKINGVCKALSGKTFKCPLPWYYKQIIDGELK